jgi:hypothetical protein
MRRVLQSDKNRAPVEFYVVRQLSPNLRVGAEYRPRDDRLVPVWNLRILEATKSRPEIAIGQSTAWPSSKTDGSAFSLSAGQSLGDGWTAYLSAVYAPNGDLWQIPAGLNYRMNDRWSARTMWDGSQLHPVLTHHSEDWSLSLLLLGGTDPTISVAVGF